MRERKRLNYKPVARYCRTCGAKLDLKIQGRAAKQCLSCRTAGDGRVVKAGYNSESPLTAKEKRSCLKLMVWLDIAKERMAGAKACINLQELVDAWREIKTIPLVVVD